MNCAEAEILICDYATLSSAERFELERHLGECPACAELARDTATALEFIGRTAEVEPPPELITRILFDAPWTKQKSGSKFKNWFRTILSPVLQPRMAMGIAMTMITLSFLWQYAVPKQLRPSDLQPTKVWAGLEDRAYYAWGRTVKFYENLKFVYQIQTMLREWQQQDEEQQPGGAQKSSARPAEQRKLPVKSAPEVPGAGEATPNASSSKASGGSK